jgi:hypothetical protein
MQGEVDSQCSYRGVESARRVVAHAPALRRRRIGKKQLDVVVGRATREIAQLWRGEFDAQHLRRQSAGADDSQNTPFRLLPESFRLVA